MIPGKLGNLLPASPADLTSRGISQPAFAEDEYRFAQMFEDDLKSYRQREKEQVESRPVEAEEEQMMQASETAGQAHRNRNKEKPEQADMEKDGNRASGSKSSDTAGKQAKQDETAKAEGTSQTTGSEGEANKAAKAENNSGSSEKFSKIAPQDTGTTSSKVHPDLMNAGTADDAESGKATTQNGKAPKADGGSLNAGLPGDKPAEMAAEKLNGTTPARDLKQETNVSNAPVHSGKAVPDVEGASNTQNQQKPEALLQDLQKNGAVKKAEGKVALVSKAAEDSKNSQTAQKPQAPKAGGNEEDKQQQQIRLFRLGAEQRTVTARPPVDRAEFIGLSVPDKQGQPGSVSASMTGKMYTADAGIKVQDSGALASDNGEQQKEFKFSLNNTIGSADESGSVRKKVVQKLASLIRQQQTQRSQQTELWQKHRLVLDDGKAIHVASRSAEGMLTLQLGVQNQELNKLIQQHLQEIKAHLQEQFGMDIDVQLQNSGQQGNPEFGEELADGGHSLTGAALSESEGTQPAERQPLRIKDLGFNTNEWIA